MKELKFRAWDGKKMIDDVIPASETSIIELFEYEHQITGVEAVEQYIGLKDKNGTFGLPYFATEEDAKRSIELHRNEWLTIFGVEDEK